MNCIIKYSGTTLRPAELTAGQDQETNGEMRLWHLAEFLELSSTGIEVLYDGPDLSVEKEIPEPFKTVSDDVFEWKTDLCFKLQEGYSLMIQPHFSYFSDRSWETPLAIPQFVQYDWWPKALTLLFRTPQEKSVFTSGKPVAQAFVVARQEHQLIKMNADEHMRRSEAEKVVDGMKDEFVTREWITKQGHCQHNLYSALVYQDKKRALPPEIKDYRRKRLIIK